MTAADQNSTSSAGDLPIAPAAGYSGDVVPAVAWQMLESRPDAVLVDVRTPAEWSFVGVPDLGAVGRRPVLVPWQLYPSNAVNPDFLAQLTELGVGQDKPVLFLCRSGVRSAAAARAAIAAGWREAYNIKDGFEGPSDSSGHRGTVAGWKVSGLPWVQG